MTYTIMMMTAIAGIVGAFHGDGTFYGEGGHGAQGACMLSKEFNGVKKTVAINAAQWEDGKACGKCVLIQPTNRGIGTTPILAPIFATIDNLCPECQHGDIDLGLNGDGRWHIEWEFVPCH